MPILGDPARMPTCLHRVIAIHARRLTPPDLSLSGTREALRGGAEAYARYLRILLEDMYSAPEAYGMRPGEFEALLGGRAENAFKQEKTSKFNTVRSRTMNAVSGYLKHLYAIARAGQIEGETLALSPEAYAGVLREADGSLNPKKKTILTDVPYPLRLQALRRTGLEIVSEGGGARVFCAAHPGMLAAMRELALAADRGKVFGEHNFQVADFRQIPDGYTPDIEDVTRPLSEDKRKRALAIHGRLLAMGLRPSCSTYWKVNYHWRGKHVACLDTDDGNGKRSFLADRFRLRVDGSDREEHLRAIEARGEAFRHFYARHLNFCTHCATSHIGRQRQAFGRTVRLCCCPQVAFRIEDPGMEDLDNIAACVELRLEEIGRQA